HRQTFAIQRTPPPAVHIAQQIHAIVNDVFAPPRNFGIEEKRIPRLNLPTHPKTSAWPCACTQAAASEAPPSRPLICRRFHPPTNVAGNSMKKSAVVRNAISSRDSASSRARISANTSAGGGAGPCGARVSAAIAVGELAMAGSFKPTPLPDRPREGKEC